VVTFSAIAQFKMLNFRLFIAPGCNFRGLILPRFADKRSPFLQAVAWNRYESPFQKGLYSGFFGTIDKILSAFSTIKTGRERLIWAGILRVVIPTDNPFLARRVSLQNILYPAFEAAPYAVQG
jgi:hypothetical protein